MEELELTDPIVVPEKVTNKYRVMSITMDLEMMVTPNVKGLVFIQLLDNLGSRFTHRYEGEQAIQMIKTLNTANLTIKSMHKRILEKLSSDGIIPGTVVGVPDGQ